MAYNLTPNRYMTGVVPIKYSAQAPHSDGTFGAEPASESIVVFHLGARPNHPLGFFAPGMGEVTKRFRGMVEELNADPVKHDLLDATRWTKDDPGGNEVMSVFYLRDYAALHRFANGGLHLDTTKWWSSIVKDHSHIAIYHETYIIPKGQWENIYINSRPTGIGDTWLPVTGEVEGKETVTKFVRPIVDARSGVLRTAAKRFNLAQLEETQQPDADLFDKTYVP